LRASSVVRTLSWVSLASLVALGSGRAWAGPEESEADALITRGIELREHGKDDEALSVFKRALDKAPSPRARAQVGLAEQALGLWVAAEADIVAALVVQSDPWIARNRAPLEGALAVIRRHLGSLEVRGTPDGAEVVLDGVALGTLPAAAPFRVEAGRRTLELRAKGYHSTARTIEVPAGGVSRETMSLVAIAPEPPSGGGTDGRGGGGGGGGDGDGGHTQRLLGWTLVGTGGALVVTGGVGLIVRKGIVDDYNVQCPGLGAAQPPTCDSKIDAARTWLTISIVSFVAGGVFVVGGLALAATAPSGSRGRTTQLDGPGARTRTSAPVRGLSCAPSPLPGGAGAFCAAVF